MTMLPNSAMAEHGQAEEAPATGARTERRSALRIAAPFPAIVRGTDSAGNAFEARVVLDNLSADGLALWLPLQVSPGATLFVVVRLTVDPAGTAHAPGVAIRGVVLHSDERASGRWSVGVMFVRHRFLFAGRGEERRGHNGNAK